MKNLFITQDVINSINEENTKEKIFDEYLAKIEQAVENNIININKKMLITLINKYLLFNTDSKIVICRYPKRRYKEDELNEIISTLENCGYFVELDIERNMIIITRDIEENSDVYEDLAIAGISTIPKQEIDSTQPQQVDEE